MGCTCGGLRAPPFGGHRRLKRHQSATHCSTRPMLPPQDGPAPGLPARAPLHAHPPAGHPGARPLRPLAPACCNAAVSRPGVQALCVSIRCLPKGHPLCSCAALPPVQGKEGIPEVLRLMNQYAIGREDLDFIAGGFLVYALVPWGLRGCWVWLVLVQEREGWRAAARAMRVAGVRGLHGPAGSWRCSPAPPPLPSPAPQTSPSSRARTPRPPSWRRTR